MLTSTYDSDQELNNEQFSQGGAVPEQAGIQMDYVWSDHPDQIRYYATAAESTILETTRLDYNSADRLVGIEHDHGGGDYSYTYTYDGGADDGADQLQSALVHGINTTFSYDVTGQLTASQNSTYGNHTYSYDAAGNSAAAGTTIGTDNEIQTDGTFNYSYDADGNRTTKISISGGDAWTYAYDDENRLITVKHWSSSSGGVPGGTLLLEEDFTYDIFGNRLSDTLTQSGSTTVTRFAYDQNGNAWADLNSSNQLVTRHLFLQGVDQIFARIDASTGHGYFYYTDGQDTVTDIMDESTGNVVDQIDYDAFGNIEHKSGATYGDRYKYTGREWDAAIDMQYSRARFYDPVTRNFISPDPAQADPLGNTYRYVDNDPMDGTDPSGEDLIAVGESAAQNIVSQLADAKIKTVAVPLPSSSESSSRAPGQWYYIPAPAPGGQVGVNWANLTPQQHEIWHAVIGVSNSLATWNGTSLQFANVSATSDLNWVQRVSIFIEKGARNLDLLQGIRPDSKTGLDVLPPDVWTLGSQIPSAAIPRNGSGSSTQLKTSAVALGLVMAGPLPSIKSQPSASPPLSEPSPAQQRANADKLSKSIARAAAFASGFSSTWKRIDDYANGKAALEALVILKRESLAVEQTTTQAGAAGQIVGSSVQTATQEKDKAGNVTFYHGTTRANAQAIMVSGAKLSLSRPKNDFSMGFYTTNSLQQAKNWAGPGGAVIEFEVSQASFASLHKIEFNTATAEGNTEW